jgi:hypothetical protein
MAGVALMEKHFFHIERGYWVAIEAPSDEVLATYPEGTIEVPPKPSPYAEWVNGSWVDHPAPPPTPEERIAELKALLAASDYKVLPHYDKPDETIVAQRQAWRDEIRELEA